MGGLRHRRRCASEGFIGRAARAVERFCRVFAETVRADRPAVRSDRASVRLCGVAVPPCGTTVRVCAAAVRSGGAPVRSCASAVRPCGASVRSGRPLITACEPRARAAAHPLPLGSTRAPPRVALARGKLASGGREQAPPPPRGRQRTPDGPPLAPGGPLARTAAPRLPVGVLLDGRARHVTSPAFAGWRAGLFRAAVGAGECRTPATRSVSCRAKHDRPRRPTATLTGGRRGAPTVASPRSRRPPAVRMRPRRAGEPRRRRRPRACSRPTT